MATNPEDVQISGLSNPFESGVDGEMVSKSITESSNKPQTLQSGTGSLQSSDIAGTKDKAGGTEARSQTSSRDMEAVPIGAGAGELSAGGATQEQETLQVVDDTAVKNGEDADQATTAVNFDKLKTQDISGDGAPSKVDDDEVASATPITNPVGLATDSKLPGNGSQDSFNDEPVYNQVESDQGLLKTAEDGSEKDIKKWMDAHANILATNSYGETALHVAFRYKNSQAIPALLKIFEEKKLDINIRDHDGWTPFYGAVRSALVINSPELVSKLLKFPGVDLTLKDNKGRTPLYMACYWGNVDIAKLILGKKEGIKTLEATDDQGWTPLQVACSEGELEVLELLLSSSYNAKTDIKDLCGRTPLHLASMKGRDTVVQALLQKYADIDVIDSDGDTALHLVVQQLADSKRKGLDVIQTLIGAHIKVDVVNFDGHTALQLAGRGEEAVYEEAIEIISRALNPEKRIDIFLEASVIEDPTARDRLFKNLYRDDFPESEKEEAELICIATQPQKTMQADDLKKSQSEVRDRLTKKFTPNNKSSPLDIRDFPSDIKKDNLSALQLAAYFGYHRLVYVLLLYSVSKWIEIKSDIDIALKLAKCVSHHMSTEPKENISARTNRIFENNSTTKRPNV